MNKEQAVSYLRFSGFSDEQIKAIEGAFTCDKCVYSTSEGCQYDDITETIPPFDKTRWIPVSERLPEHYQNILFSTKTDRVFEGRYFKDETEHQWYSFRDECFAWNNVVTAWMPLPEPYKTEGSDKK